MDVREANRRRIAQLPQPTSREQIVALLIRHESVIGELAREKWTEQNDAYRAWWVAQAESSLRRLREAIDKL